MTILRDPADRLVSHYNFRRSRGVISAEFEDWLDSEFRSSGFNPIVNFYAARLQKQSIAANHPFQLELAKEAIRRCWLVGYTERLDVDLKLLFAAMGLPLEWENYRIAGISDDRLVGLEHPSEGEVIRRYVTLDDALRARIYEATPQDYEFYLWCRETRL